MHIKPRYQALALMSLVVLSFWAAQDVSAYDVQWAAPVTREVDSARKSMTEKLYEFFSPLLMSAGIIGALMTFFGFVNRHWRLIGAGLLSAGIYAAVCLNVILGSIMMIAGAGFILFAMFMDHPDEDEDEDGTKKSKKKKKGKSAGKRADDDINGYSPDPVSGDSRASFNPDDTLKRPVDLKNDAFTRGLR